MPPTSAKIYRALLVGTGGIGDAHVRAVEATQGRVQLVAAVDLDATRVKAFCERHRIPVAHTDYVAALSEVRPDIVLIAAPPSLHRPMSIAAMEAGAWVLCEKPFCGSLAELDDIEAAEQRTGQHAACVFQMRFASSTAHLRALADAGAPIRVHEDVRDVVPLFTRARLALVAAGSTVWELARCGVPSLCVSVAANQRVVGAGLAQAGAGLDAGYVGETTPAALVAAAFVLHDDGLRLAAMSRAARTLVDGRGVLRVIDALIDVSERRSLGA